MKNTPALSILAGTLTLAVALAAALAAAPAASARQLNKEECSRRCNASEGGTNPRIATIDKKLAEIRAQKKVEQDPAKLKALESAEEDQIEQREDEHEKSCRYICGTDGA